MCKWFVALILLLLFSVTAIADSTEKFETIRAKLETSFPEFKPDSIKASPLDGFVEVAYGTNIFYVSKDAKFLIQGRLLDLENNNKDLTAISTNEVRKGFIGEVNDLESISFGAEKPRHTVAVFTDIDCPYCQKLHDEMDQYASYGIKVNYFLFPRNGLTSPGYLKAVSVWCSDDRADALTRAKARQKIEDKTCDNPVGDHFAIGKKLGVTGTPAMLTEDGRLIPGYMPAKDLAQRLDEKV